MNHPPRWKLYLAEALIGLLVAVVLAIALSAGFVEVEFVYQAF